MFFSVVIPLYNDEATIARALKSVLAQAHQGFEVIVVNDGSTDAGPQIVRRFCEPRIRLIDQANAGVSAARNRGIDEATAEFIAFLDADDEWQPDHLAQFARLRTAFPNCGVLASRYWMERDPDHRRPSIVRGLDPEFEGILRHYFRIASRSEPPVCSSAVAATRSALRAVGGFPVGVTVGEDLLTWAKLALQTEIAYSMHATSTFHMAPCHYFRAHPSERRQAQTSDVVGAQLAAMCSGMWSRNAAKDIRRYVARWYQMRAQALLFAGRRAESSRALFLSLLYNPCQPKLAAYLGLLMVPLPVVLASYRAFSRSAQL
jgi:hypothetical protein